MPRPSRKRPPRRLGRTLALASAVDGWLNRLDAVDRKAPLTPAAAAALRALFAAARPVLARHRGGPLGLGPDPLAPGEAVVALLKLRLALEPDLP
jgi:hypothetical protein